jgi:hypothetical protein
MTRRSIFGVPMSEGSNRLWETDSVVGHWSCDVQETVNDLERVEEKGVLEGHCARRLHPGQWGAAL